MAASDATRRPAQWSEESVRPHADCRVFSVERRSFRHPARTQASDFFVVKPADWAVALARTPQGKWVMARQFRFGSRSLTWEFPSGCINPGESPAAAAIRELEEESGYKGAEPLYLGKVQPNPAIMDNNCHYFLITEATPNGSINWDEHEEIEIAELSDETVRQWAVDGTISHSLIHAGLFLHDAWQKRSKAEG